ncbi:MAG: hydrogenase small subunit [Thiovulaceae bacterium]|nr:hydrogenase small subunit [Sulfurimonadaceae bacterium]
MRIVIVGGGIVAAYMANVFKEEAPEHEVLIVSKEEYPPYDRIHLCDLINKTKSIEEIALELPSGVKLELNAEVVQIDRKAKRIYTKTSAFAYDILVIATGSKPRTLFGIEGMKNAVTFRSSNDSACIAECIKDKNIVVIGVGPIGLELLDTLCTLEEPKKIYLVSRGTHLYDKAMTPASVSMMKRIYEEADPRVEILLEEEIVDKTIEGDEITKIVMKSRTIEDPFVIFGIGITPSAEFAKGVLDVDKGILVDEHMRSCDPSIYAVGEVAQLPDGYIAGRVKECTMEADAAVASILGKESKGFKEFVTIDGLKVGSFLLADVTSTRYDRKDENNEEIVIASRKEERVDHYITNGKRLVRFIGINTNIDVMALKRMMEQDEEVDASYFYTNRLVSERGKLICSCASGYEKDLVEIIKTNCVESFGDLKPFSEAGRVCGRCKSDVAQLIADTPVDPEEAARIKAEREAALKAEELAKVQRRIDKFNTLHPKNMIGSDNLEEAIKAFDMNREYSRWVSMITANMHLHPDYEPLVSRGVEQLNKIPIIWLELADCSGNSEGFIKTAHPKMEDLILKYISLDYHELLMAASGDESESVLDSIIKNDAGRYILMVEGAIPMGLDGKFLRIGTKGETGYELLKRVAKNAAAILSIGSCAFDGGVVAAAPNPTGAVGVAEALGRDDIINLPGCPVNPINIVGTLLHYLMFDEMPKLDAKNRPEWAYGFRIHDNCERRGHYDLDEFVLEWGDEGAKKGWCLFQMGCKGPYADLNCSLVRFNEGTSWPVQAGHGCFACGQGKIAFDKYANHRPLAQEDIPHENKS